MKNKEPNFGWNKTIEELAKLSNPIGVNDKIKPPLNDSDILKLSEVKFRNERGYTNAVYGFTEDTHKQMREDIESLLTILNKIITQTN